MEDLGKHKICPPVRSALLSVTSYFYETEGWVYKEAHRQIYMTSSVKPFFQMHVSISRDFWVTQVLVWGWAELGSQSFINLNIQRLSFFTDKMVAVIFRRDPVI